VAAVTALAASSGAEQSTTTTVLPANRRNRRNRPGVCMESACHRRPFGGQVSARRQERPAVRRGSTARQAPDTTRRVAIPLLEWLDRAGVTRRLADDRRTMREPPGSPKPNGER
jgi:hypothetical protein